MALLSSSLTTRAASLIAVSKIPAASRSAVSRCRATATLAGAHGRSTALESLTSLSTRPDAEHSAMETDLLGAKCPERRHRKLITRPLSLAAASGQCLAQGDQGWQAANRAPGRPADPG